MATATFKGKTVHMDQTVKTADGKDLRGKGVVRTRFRAAGINGAEGIVQDSPVNAAAVVIEVREAVAYRNSKGDVRYMGNDTVVNSVEYALSALNEETLNTLAASAYAKTLETYINNHMSDLKGSDAIDKASKRATEIVEGKLLVRAARGEGNGKGKSADITMYVEAFKLTYQMRKMGTPTQEAVEAFSAKLAATAGKERLQAIGKMNAQPIFKRAILQVKADNLKELTKGKRDEVNYMDLF